MAKATADRDQARSTPLMRQYREAKKAYPDAIMLFRMGDFYETFEEDAKVTSQVLGIALTKRSNQGRSKKSGPATEVPLAGFPHHALEAHLHKLLTAGYKVAVCEQVEDPKLAKGLVKRKVVEVITPGTALAEKFLEKGENNFLASVCLQKDQAGLALLDHSTGEFFLEEVSTDVLADHLWRYQPAEVLVPEGHKDELQQLLGQSRTLITTYQDWIAEADNGSHELREHFGTTSLKGFGVEEYPLGIGAAGAIVHYIHQNSPGPKSHISSLRALQDEHYLGLDNFTVRNLELFQSLATQGTHGTLISVLDQTRTAAGSRLLKQWLRTPLRDRDSINERLDRVEELVGDSRLREDLQSMVQGSSDMERILGRLATRRASPRDVANLANSLEIIGGICECIQAGKVKAVGRLKDRFHPTQDLVDLIRSALVEDPPINMAKGDYIRETYHAELDELRNLARSGKSWIANLQETERQRTGIPSLKVGYNNVFGYYLEVTKTHQEKVPADYIRKQTLVNAERYVTPELKEYEEKVLSAEDKILALVRELFDQLQEQVLTHAREIQENARLLATLDISLALAEVAVRNRYTKPILVEEPILSLRDSRHPVVEILLPVGERFTPNSLEMDPEKSQIHVITGPNMAGKSTYLRQVGLVVVMAQMGSFVPAEEARIGIVDRVFTRVGASDNLAGGESTFLVEMVETARILHNATGRSLVLLDEIGRGTSTYDGLSIAWAVIEYLHQDQEVSAKTLFATHYHELVSLAEVLPRVENFNVAVREHGKEVVFLRRIVPGGTDRSYGIHVAQMAGLPQPVIRRAGEILTSLTERAEGTTTIELRSEPSTQTELFAAQEQALRDDFKQVDVDAMTPIDALNLLDKLKKKHGL
ncbi:MAG: DNA mismatch repair protein MutS [Fidelibacterota bacterium]|nr:MAG: DNA mismatch repair protein MutS [Candidatus Neomarinimicrobiota bacterium]